MEHNLLRYDTAIKAIWQLYRRDKWHLTEVFRPPPEIADLYPNVDYVAKLIELHQAAQCDALKDKDRLRRQSDWTPLLRRCPWIVDMAVLFIGLYILDYIEL